MDFQKFLRTLEPVPSIAITAPSPPDGDSVGAQCALKELLEQKYPQKTIRIINEDPCPFRYSFLKQSQHFELSKNIQDSPEAWICVDGGPGRSGEATLKLWRQAKIHGLIDHHVVGSTEKFDLSLYSPQAAATTELVFKLLKATELELTQSIAQALYVGLIYDTGLFKHSNTTPEIMRIGAELLETKFNHTDTAERALLLRTEPNIKLLRNILNSFTLDQGISSASITIKDYTEAKATVDDKDGLIDVLFLIPGCKVSVLFSEADTNVWKLSFRSRGIDVASAARELTPQGGGHKLASGCTLNGDFEEIKSRVIQLLREKLQNS